VLVIFPKKRKPKKEEVNHIRKRSGITINFAENEIKTIEEKYLPKLNKLKRRRRFILEKLLFFKN